MDVPVGGQFTTSLVIPPGDWADGSLGARVESPVTRAIVSYWRAATLSGSLLTVTLDSPVEPGDYQLVWMDNGATPTIEYFIPVRAVSSISEVAKIEYPEVDQGEVRSSVDDVARLMRTRTVGSGSEDTVTFTDETDPTADDIEATIDDAMDNVLSMLPIPQVNPEYYSQIKRAITLQTVLIADPSFWREEAGDDAMKFYQNMYDSIVSGIQARIQRDLNQANLVKGMEPDLARILYRRRWLRG